MQHVLCLCRVETQPLLGHTQSALSVFLDEALCIDSPQLVVGLALDEAIDEVGGIKRKNSVVEGDVHLRIALVLDTQTSMPEAFVRIGSGGTGQQTDAQRVGEIYLRTRG